MVTASSVVVSYIQGLNPAWLVQPWQQGLVLMLLLAFSGVLAAQRLSVALTIAKVTLVIAFLAVFLIGLAGVISLLQGHHIATSFSTPTDWGLTWTPNGYYVLALFGFITQAYLGIEVPLNMGGEITRHRVVTRHLLWGTVLVFVGYFVTTFGVLVVQGTSQSGNAFVLVMTVDAVFGKTIGAIAALLIMFNFVVTPAVYNYAYARLLLVGGIDQYLPVNISRLNKHRVPINAIVLQTVTAVVFAGIIYVVVPLFGGSSNAATLNSDVYNVVISASTLVWAISTAFIFINLAKFYFNDRQAFHAKRIFPMPVLWISVVLGIATCAISIVGSLVYSLIPNQIDNFHWWYIVGGITIVCLVVAAIGSMLANSEANWQSLTKY